MSGIEHDRITTAAQKEEDQAFDRAIRPKVLEDYVGQPRVKKQMGIFIQAARNAGVVWVCRPGNPVGAGPDDADLEAIIAGTAGIVVLDAAYSEFAGERWADAVGRFPNLLVLHTLSKAYGLGGARVGYALGHPDLIAGIDMAAEAFETMHAELGEG